MASFDVENLLTNISLNETIESCIKDLFSNNDTVHKMSHFPHLITNIIDNYIVSP